ncbi:hypothetical protein OJAV_G00132980 [Oryzias javanicus]|uniref:Ig-like domain-containing protein n=1 Tax=Oryzias javanicus TaxID=123683 RepID=A0A3S2MDR9_ORYJA|nr:hypothetical protein OJAV_G00132980 [Oryzias javanicus]
MFKFGGIRSEMLTSWLTITVILTASANPGRGAPGRSSLTVAPTCRINGQPQAELTLGCGDGEKTGEVRRWHTPFGGLQTSGVHTQLDPVFMNQDGSLVIPNSSFLHSGLYYCLLQHTEGAALWPYELHVHLHPQLHDFEQGSSCAALRVRRNTGSAEEAEVSDEAFAGAVSASVVLTFVLGFSAGALNRNGVLRCLRAVSRRLCSCRKRRSRSDTPDGGPQFNMSTVPSAHQRSSDSEDETASGSANPDMDRTISSTNSPPPPVKPRRSFQLHLDQKKAGAAYLEGCEYMKVKSKKKERRVEEIEENDEEVKEEECPSEGGGSVSETGDGSGEEKEVSDVEEGMDEDAAARQRCMEEESGGESERSCRGSEDERNSKNEETTADVTEEASARRRVIRLYQYDDDGQKYGHLPKATGEDAGPAPRFKQRSLSLTRLNAIMAAASAGPLDNREDGEETPRFQMDI